MVKLVTPRALVLSGGTTRSSTAATDRNDWPSGSPAGALVDGEQVAGGEAGGPVGRLGGAGGPGELAGAGRVASKGPPRLAGAECGGGEQFSIWSTQSPKPSMSWSAIITG